ncbi:MAG TPA: sulfatase, partial [Planctomycetota bacterium]|nr:sulfatase [Planctomycetota bacterium]
SSASKQPKLLLLSWDPTRAESLSFYGYDKATTPNLARLAAESIVFEHARSASRYTLTSHLSMLTGVYPSHHGARMTRQRISPRDTPSIAATLREKGYRTAAFVGTGVLSAPTGVAFGFEHYDDQVDPPVCDTLAWSLVHDLQSVVASFGPPFSHNGQPHWFQDFFRPANDVLASAAQWIGNGDARPWFVMVNLYDAHWPYVPDADARAKWVEPYDGIVDGFHSRSDRYPRGYAMQPRDDVHLRELYDAELSELDLAVDRFLGELDLAHHDTAVLMCSDHGEAFGEGGRYEHNDILEPQVHIPFLLHPPRATESASRRVAAPVSGVDVAPTLLALAGVEVPAHFTGFDVQRLGPDAQSASRTILVEDRDQMHATDVRLALYRREAAPASKTWKLVRRGLGAEQRFQLFDLGSDPIGLHDLAEENPELVAELRVELDAFRARWHADDVKDQQDTGASNVDTLRALGYAGNEPDSPPPPLPGH